jgi:phosphohistidine phosphatase
MKRSLLIMRHGKSDWDTDNKSDFERPLAKRGQKAVKRIGQWLIQQKLTPDHIISSPANRAQQTAIGICRKLKLAESSITWESRIYGADMETLLDVLAACPAEKQRVMLIGHNPGLEMLLRYLAGETFETSHENNPMPTAALAFLDMPDNWEGLDAGAGQLTFIIRPRELTDV